MAARLPQEASILRATSLLFLTLFVTRSASAQWLPDFYARRLSWGNVNLVVRRDTVAGVQIWAVTSRTLHRDTPRRQFAARFDPDSAVTWMAYAEKVLAAPSPPTDPTAILLTPILLATDRSQLALARGQNGGKWNEGLQLRLSAPDGKAPWTIAVKPEEVRRFLTLFFEAAAASGYHPEIPVPFEPNPADSASCPSPLADRIVSYPNNRIGQSGEVWLTFVVRADSTVDQRTIRVVLSDGIEFTASAVRAVTSVRYRPAMTKTGPLSAIAFQRVTFTMAN